jgi:hypothetical protein
MKKLFIKFLAIAILTSFTTETVLLITERTVFEFSAGIEKEDSEKQTEEEKAEKETEKDKINFSNRTRFQNSCELQQYGLHFSIVTSACLSLPEIPPDLM